MANFLFGIFLILLKTIEIISPNFLFEKNLYLNITNEYKKEVNTIIDELTFLKNNQGLVVPTKKVTFDRPTKINNETLIIKGKSVIALDLKSGFQLFGQNPDEKMPIASISKIMSAMVFLDTKPDLNKIYKIKKSDKREGGKMNLFNGDQLTARDLFYTALVGSDNVAIIGLVNLSGLSEQDFVAAMNKKSKDLNLKNTEFYDPTGLNEKNISTARDINKFFRKAIEYPDIKRAVSSKRYRFKTLEDKEKLIENTDELLSKKDIDFKIIGGKTGYLNEAGYCFVGMFNKNNRDIISVILGADSKEARFSETEKLLNWIFKVYQWEKIN